MRGASSVPDTTAHRSARLPLAAGHQRGQIRGIEVEAQVQRHRRSTLTLCIHLAGAGARD
jgi:hypothetical protein